VVFLTPSPLWYTTRAAGTVTIALLSLTTVLGMAQTVRFKSSFWPKYLTVGLHSYVALTLLVFLGLHIVTSLLDPFAKLGWKDAVLPFASWYRPLWLGLGVLAAEVYLAVAITSIVRKWMSYRIWQTIHWSAYACWPIALLHGLGTGTDPRRAWFLWINLACVLGFFLFLVAWRLSFGWPRLAWPRLLAAALSGVAMVALAVWALNGPLAPGWAVAAGTPVQLILSTTAATHSTPATPQQPTPSNSP
jgi:methionine sulfoxide reductase heme-binding subunit